MKRKSKIYVTWAISYIILLLLPVIAGLGIYSYMFSVVKDEITQSNQIIVQNMQRETDSILEEVERIHDQISVNEKITSLLSSGQPMTTYTRYIMNEVSRDLNIYSASNKYIQNFYIILQNLDYCITPSVSRPSDNYFLSQRGMSAENMNRIKNAATGESGNHILVCNETDRLGNETKVVLFIQTLPVGEKTVNGAIVMEIDQNWFLAYSDKNEREQMGNFYILDKSEQLLPITGEEIDDVSKILIDADVERRELDGSDVYIIQSRSVSSGWHYISVIDNNVFMARMRKPKYIVIMMVCIYILLAAVADFFLLRYNYHPLRNLVSAVRDRAGTEFESGESLDEYTFIEQALTKVVTEKEQVDMLLRQQKNTLRHNFIERLLRGTNNSGIPVKESLESFQIPIASNRGVVVLISPEDVENLFAEEASLSNKKRQELALVILENILTEIASRHGSAFSVAIDEFLACCIMLREEEIQKRRKLIERDLEECEQVIGDNFGFSFIAAISEVHNIEDGMDIAYKETMAAMEYKIINQESRRIWYMDLQEKQQSGYYYPLEKERQIIYLVRSGNKEEAELVLEEVFRENFESEFMPMQLVKCLMFDIASTMIKTIQEVFGNHQEEFLDSLKPVDRITKCDNISDLRAAVSDILSTVCEYVERQGKNEIRNKVEQFVQENYSNTNLSVAVVAEHLKIHPNYASMLFKNQTGMGLLDYISKVRIEKAKVLLQETGYTVEQISNAVGYTNRGTFMRVFKKLEGVTPTQFRGGTHS